MQADLVARLREGMRVEDADGDAVGTVSKVCLPAGVVYSLTAPSTSTDEVCLKVHIGLPLLGKS